MAKKKSNNITLPVTALTPAQIEGVKAISEANTISLTAVMRQAIAQFLDQPEDCISAYVNRDYGQCETFTNIYCSAEHAAGLDALAEKFDKPRNQIVRAAIAKYLEKEGDA